MKKSYFLVIFSFLSTHANVLDVASLLESSTPPSAQSTQAKSAGPLNLSSLVTVVPAKSIKTNASVGQINSLVQNIEAQENNPDYQAALTILHDKQTKESYRQNLISIQLFFLDYSTQILQKYSVQAAKNQKPINLTQLMQQVTPPAAKSSGINQLSNLAELLQKQTVSKSTDGVTQKTIDFASLLSVPAVQQNPATAKTVNLSNLLTPGQ